MRTTYRYINGTHTFYTLNLAKDPLAVATEAQRQARLSIARTYKQFMQLTPSYSSYGMLQKLYAWGNREYYQGNIFFNRARLAKGNRALALFARAASCFCRCQARLEQVYEIIKPPPTSPRELGLKPFGGDWAVWETRLK